MHKGLFAQVVVLSAALTGCYSSWEVKDIDNDGIVGLDDCWESSEDPVPPEGALDHGVKAKDIYKGAVDLPYDGIDANCDGKDDFDQDEDGFVPTEYLGIQTLGIDTSGQLPEGDCDDADPIRNPATVELCDGIVNGCIDLPAIEIDDDNDGFVDCTIDATGWKGDASVIGGDDCNDQDEIEFPGQIWFVDQDADGFGSDSATEISCPQPTGFVPNNDDCVDLDATVYPSAPELCDGQVNACGTELPVVEIDDDGDFFVDCIIDPNGWDGDGSIIGGNDCDDTDAIVFPNITYYADTDNDGFGDNAVNLLACAMPSGYVADNTDCDDSNETIYPNAPELCDGLINTCGGALPSNEIDEDLDTFVACTIDAGGWDGDATVVGGDDCQPSDAFFSPLTVWYLDADTDGFGNTAVSQASCSQPTNYVLSNTDCNDSAITIFPNAPELCDGLVNTCGGALPSNEIDDDVDGFVECSLVVAVGSWGNGTITGGSDCNDANANEFPGQVWYDDGDNDSYGDVSDSMVQCAQPVGHVLDNTDCVDSNPHTYPNANEICDGLVNTCGGTLQANEIDNDGDFYVDCLVDPSGWQGSFIFGGNDCNDADSTIYPNITYYADTDNDGFGNPNNTTVACSVPSGYVSDFTDCDDTEATRNPGYAEICDGLDNDCNNVVPAIEIDNDGDLFVECVFDASGWDGNPNLGDNDCNDANANEFPGQVWYDDGDNDSYGDPLDSVVQCLQPVGHVLDNTDCVDTKSVTHPNANEICDGLDNNCDNALPQEEMDSDGDRFVTCTIDTGGWQGDPDIVGGNDCDNANPLWFPTQIWFHDADGDTFGNANDTRIQCGQPGSFVLNNTDCDDTQSTRFPGNSEICDGLDNDCAGGVPSIEVDNDTDGYVDCVIDPTGWDGTNISGGGDCNDANAIEFPGQIWYADVDVDTYGDLNNSLTQCSQPVGFIRNNTDCDDNESTKFPGNPEICDGLDNDCVNGVPSNETDDDGDLFVECIFHSTGWDGPSNLQGNDCDDTDANEKPGQIWYQDSDNDSFGKSNVSLSQCLRPSGYVVTSGDCEDTKPTMFPNNPEICDGLDNNCDTVLPANETDDDGDLYVECSLSVAVGAWGNGAITGGGDCNDSNANEKPNQRWYADSDGDTYGNSGVFINQCTQPNGYVLNNTDCADSTSARFPGNPEVCDGLDNNCDTILPTTETDDDSDGYVECSITTWRGVVSVVGGNDCDDADILEYPGQTWYLDADVDTYGAGAATITCARPAANYSHRNGDCADNALNIYPNAPELCDGIDNDCNNALPNNERDIDTDGYVACNLDVLVGSWGDGVILGGSDCNDNNAGLFPNQTWYRDSDGDTYGTTNTTQQSCPQPNGYVLNSTDCNDNVVTIHPNATELCNGVDDNCDLVVPVTEIDNDGDGYVECVISANVWNSIIGGGDCDDTTGNQHPNKTELCDGIDNDCNNVLPNNERDLDGDGYVECALDVAVGSWGNGAISGGDDCDNAVGSGEFTFPNAGFNESAPLNTQCLTDEDGDGYALWESCYTLVMTDTNSNTWDGAAIGMWVDGVFFDKYSLTTNVASRTETVCVNGDTIAFEFLLSATGTANDIGATITDENGATITITGHDANPDDYVTTSLGGSTHYSTGDVFHTVSPLSKGTDCDDTDEFTFPGAASIDSASECMTDVDGDNYGLIVENCFTVNMTDGSSNPNGWGNNYIDIYWQGVLSDSVTLSSGASGSSDVCLFTSGSIQFKFDGSGNAQFGGSIIDLTGVAHAFSNPSNNASLYSASVTLNVPIGLVSGTDSNDSNVSVH